MTVRIGVVGTAGIGLAHLFAAQVLEDEELVAVCDSVPERAERAAADFGGQVFTDAHALFSSGAADAVVLATPPDSHTPLALSALEHGLHVYLEKPIAPTAAEGEAIARKAADAGRAVQVGFQFRYTPAYQRARALVADGEIGAVFRADLSATTWFRPRRYFADAAWRSQWARAGGGVLMSQAIHQLDGLIGLAGAPDRVTGRAWRSRHPVPVEGDVMAMLEWDAGARGVLVASIADPIGSERIEVHGERASLRLDGGDLWLGTFAGPAQRLLDADEGDVFDHVEVSWERLVEGGGRAEEFEAIQACHRDFLTAVAGGPAPGNHPRSATAAVGVANAVYLSALSGRAEAVPPDPADYAAVLAQLDRGEIALPERPGRLA